MCRLFALRAEHPVNAEPALFSAPHALMRQSCCDLRGECHPSGWGLAYYTAAGVNLVRSTKPAAEDDAYREAVQTATSPIIIGHVRQASVGGVSMANTHPFVYKRWAFAHNGTIQGFADNPAPLREMIAPHLLSQIQGETDSEHLFNLILGRLEQLAATDEDGMAKVIADVCREVSQRYPGTLEEPTRLNVVCTDGDRFIATRWGHTLYHTLLPAVGVITENGQASGRGIAVASEPVTTTGWEEMPDRSVLVVRRNLSHTIIA